MVLVDFTVDGGGGFFMTSLGNCLVDDARGNLLMDGGVMMTSFMPDRTEETLDWIVDMMQ